MTTTSAERLLQVWETRSDAHPIQRALALLAAVWPQLSVEDWAQASIGERDACLLALREALFGEQLQTSADCPACGERLESGFSTRDICPQAQALPGPRTTLQWQDGDHQIRYRLPCSADLLDISAGGRGPLADAAAELLQRCVIDARCGREALDAAALPAALVARLTQEMAERDPAADIRLNLSCPACGHGWVSGFDIVSYLWSELDDWAQTLLADVHLLAGAYGWSERDILAMSATRRRWYLDMVRA